MLHWWGNERDLWGNKRELLGNEKDLWCNERELWGNEKDLWGNERELWGNEKDLWGNERELWGNERDWLGIYLPLYMLKNFLVPSTSRRGLSSESSFSALGGRETTPNQLAHLKIFVEGYV